MNVIEAVCEILAAARADADTAATHCSSVFERREPATLRLTESDLQAVVQRLPEDVAGNHVFAQDQPRRSALAHVNGREQRIAACGDLAAVRQGWLERSALGRMVTKAEVANAVVAVAGMGGTAGTDLDLLAGMVAAS